MRDITTPLKKGRGFIVKWRLGGVYRCLDTLDSQLDKRLMSKLSTQKAWAHVNKAIFWNADSERSSINNNYVVL